MSYSNLQKVLYSLILLALVLRLAGCAPTETPATAEEKYRMWFDSSGEPLSEEPNDDGAWRGHRLARCSLQMELDSRVRRCLADCAELFAEGSGSDGMIELEICLEEGASHPLLMVVLGQLYLMAGQGEPNLLPAEGPAGDVGDWRRNKPRLLERAQRLLEEAAIGLPDEAGVDYLLADVARAREQFELAGNLQARGLGKCTGGPVFSELRFYQHLNRYPAKLLDAPVPDYPESAVQEGLAGTVELDLLLSPAGKVEQVVPIRSPGDALFKSAATTFRKGTYEPARVGKYPVWSWLRVRTNFRLQEN